MDCIEVVQELPKTIYEQSRSQFIRDIIERFIKSDDRYWHVVKDYDGRSIDQRKTRCLYSHFYQVVSKEYATKGVFVTRRNGEIYLAKEGF